MYRRLCCLDHFCRIHDLDLLWIVGLAFQTFSYDVFNTDQNDFYILFLGNGINAPSIIAAGALSPPIASSTTVVISDMIFPPVSTGNILLNITGKINTYLYNMTINAAVISPILISIEMELIVLESS